MTITLKTYTNANYHIEVSQDKFSNCYRVEVCRSYGDGLCGYPLKKNTYKTIEKATARFNKLVNEYN